jgi:TFIIF-interacting CTD phosphatase-like protein
MLVSLSPRATQQLLLRSCGSSTVGSLRGLLVKNGARATSIPARLFYSTCTRAQPTVSASVRQRRPVVRGEAIAFHVKDLDGSRSQRLYNHSPAAALYDEDDEDYAEEEPAREYESDLIVVLDMDECLIHSQFLTNNPGAKFYAHQVARNSKDENGEPAAGRVDSFKFNLPDGDLVQVNKRPFLEEFLQAVTSKYETHIYTAAMKVYAEPILDILDPQGDRFAKRWYRESCDLDKNMGAYVKNLGSLPLQKKPQQDTSPPRRGMTYDEFLKSTSPSSGQNGDSKNSHLRRVVLVDNNPLSFLANPTNGILVSSFYNDPTDKTLPAVLDLLQELDPLDDVRPTLDARFGLKAALSEIQGNRRQQQQGGQYQWGK